MDNNVAKIKLSTVLLIIAIISIIILSLFTYKLYTDSEKAIKKNAQYETQINQLNQTVEELHKIINNIPEKNTTEISNTTTENIVNTNSISQNNSKSDETTSINYEEFLGKWYESEKDAHHGEHDNPNCLTISDISGNKLKMSLYITRTADFNNFDVTFNKGSGTFEANDDIDTSRTIKGKIQISNNTIKINITKSNTRDINDGDEYVFKYRVAP